MSLCVMPRRRLLLFLLLQIAVAQRQRVDGGSNSYTQYPQQQQHYAPNYAAQYGSAQGQYGQRTSTGSTAAQQQYSQQQQYYSYNNNNNAYGGGTGGYQQQQPQYGSSGGSYYYSNGNYPQSQYSSAQSPSYAYGQQTVVVPSSPQGAGGQYGTPQQQQPIPIVQSGSQQGLTQLSGTGQQISSHGSSQGQQYNAGQGQYSSAQRQQGQYASTGGQGGQYASTGGQGGQYASTGGQGGQYASTGGQAGQYASTGGQGGQYASTGGQGGQYASTGGQGGQYASTGGQGGQVQQFTTRQAYFTTPTPLNLPSHPPTLATLLPSLFPTPPSQPIYDAQAAVAAAQEPYEWNFDFAQGTPVVYCSYGANPIPVYNTPKKKCIPYHPLCGLTFTCIFDVDPRTGHIWGQSKETKRKK